MDFRDRREDFRQEAAEIFEVGTGTTTSEAGTVVEGGLSNAVSLDHVDEACLPSFLRFV